MWPGRLSNPEPLGFESDALPPTLRGPASTFLKESYIRLFSWMILNHGHDGFVSSGHYMYIDPYHDPPYNSYSSSTHYRSRSATMTSPEFPPAQEYCIRFWYTLYGTNIGTFKVYAKVQYYILLYCHNNSIFFFSLSSLIKNSNMTQTFFPMSVKKAAPCENL